MSFAKEDKAPGSPQAWDLLLEISQILNAQDLELGSVLQAIVRQLAQWKGEPCTLTLRLDGGEWVNYCAEGPIHPRGLELLPRHSPEPSSVTNASASTGEVHAVLISEISAADQLEMFPAVLRKYLERFKAGTLISVPLKVGGQGIGWLSILRGSGTPLDNVDLKLLTEIASRTALVVENARLVQQLEQERQNFQRERGRLSAILEQMPSAVSVVDASTKQPLLTNSQNQAIFREKHFPSGALSAQGYRGVHADGREIEPSEWPIFRSIATGEVVRGKEIHILRGDGTDGFIRVNSGPIRDEQGQIVAGIAIYDDITEQKQFEDELRHRRELLRLITDALPVLASFVSSDKRFRFVNKAYQDWFGLPPESLVGKEMEEVVDPQAAVQIRPYVEAALAGKPTVFEGKLPYPTGTKEVRVNFVPQTNDRGDVMGFVGIVTDVSESNEATRRSRFLAGVSALLSSSLDYQTTLKTVAHLAVPQLADWCVVEMAGDLAEAPLAVAHKDPQMLQVALEFRKRYPPRHDAPTGAPHVMRTGVSEIYEEITDQMLVMGCRDEEELRFARELKLNSAITVPIKTPRGVVGAITLITGEGGRRFHAKDLPFVEDIAARSALAIENATLYSEAQAAILKRDDFLSVASHELKTPLTSLDLHVEGLLRWAELGRLKDVPIEKLVDKLRKVGVQSTRIARLVDELLDVSRIAAGRLQLQSAKMDLALLAREVAARFQEQPTAAAHLEVHGLHSLVGLWDRNRLDQVLTNLLSNALKYGQGRPIALSLQEVEGKARLEVRDHGLGIASEDQERIFERFERAVPSRNYGGIGLGLWICRQIVEAHGGRITVASKAGEGSTFWVDLPLITVEGKHP